MVIAIYRHENESEEYFQLRIANHLSMLVKS